MWEVIKHGPVSICENWTYLSQIGENENDNDRSPRFISLLKNLWWGLCCSAAIFGVQKWLVTAMSPTRFCVAAHPKWLFCLKSMRHWLVTDDFIVSAVQCHPIATTWQPPPPFVQTPTWPMKTSLRIPCYWVVPVLTTPQVWQQFNFLHKPTYV
jgi:hypothetical protein